MVLESGIDWDESQGSYRGLKYQLSFPELLVTWHITHQTE